MLQARHRTLRNAWALCLLAARLCAADCPPTGMTPAEAQARFVAIQARTNTLFEQRAPLMRIVSKRAQATATHWIYTVLEDLHGTDQLIGHYDLLRIEQIINNLLDNAIKYSPARSEIEVGVSVDHNGPGGIEEVLMRIKDQGVGIAEQDIPHIFERFYRSHTLDESISGFGIGLYLTKELVQAHGGRIWAESALGRGSTFFVALPLGELR